MASTDDLNCLVSRLQTFEAPKQLSKRRASSTKKKTPGTVTWPHSNPAPEDLARAGLYYTPIPNHIDNVTCFACARSLDGWEPDDKPALEHLALAPDCPWAICTSVAYRADDPEDPMGERQVEARGATFDGKWPHETKKGWKCKTKKMVEAGWCFDPSPEFDDGVTCFYCNISLDGWEPKDNPMDEHRRRSPECSFFVLLDEFSAARKATKGKKGRASTASRTSRLSMQSNFTTFSETPSLMSLGDDAPNEDDSVLTTASMPRGRALKAKTATGGAKSGKKTARGKKAMTEPEPVPEVEPDLELEDRDLSLGDVEANDEDSAMTTATNASKTSKGGRSRKAANTTKKSTRKTTRGKKTVVVEDSVLADEPMTGMDSELEAPVAQAPVGHATRRTSRLDAHSYAEVTIQIEDSQDIEMKKKPKAKAMKASRAKATKSKAKAKQPTSLEEDESQLQSELRDAVRRESNQDEVEPPRATRGTKRTSDGAAKVDTSNLTANDAPEPKPTRGRRMKEVAIPRSSDVSEIEPEQPAKSPAKAERGRKPKKSVEVTAVQPEPEPEPEVPQEEIEHDMEEGEQEPASEYEMEPEHEMELEHEMASEHEMEPEPTLEDFPAPPSSAQRPEAFPDQFQELEEEEAPTSPQAESTPQPSFTRISPSPAPAEPTPVPASPTPTPKELTPSPSPQSSNAENRPPSTRPASARPPLTDRQTRIPLATSTPQSSPSKRNNATIAGGLSTALPWQPIDLENIFLQSPATRKQLLGADFADGMENDEELSLEAAVARVHAGLSSEEKGMSVEEWVHWRAKMGEERLRDECERLVGVFEVQGGRAMKALEGIDCA